MYQPSYREEYSWRRRLFYAFIASLVMIAILAAGSFTEISPEEAESIMRAAEAIIGPDLSPERIVLNNLPIALLMMIPVLGLVIAAFAMYSTGLVFAAIATTMQTHPALLLIIPFITVYGILEFLAYGFAVSEGVLIIRQALKRRLRSELRSIPIVIAVVAVLLVAAALLEYALISAFMQTAV